MRWSPQLDASRYIGQSGAEVYFRRRHFTRKREFNQKCCSYCLFEEKRSSRQVSPWQAATVNAQTNTQKSGFHKSIFACKANNRRPTIALYPSARKCCEAKHVYFGIKLHIVNANLWAGVIFVIAIANSWPITISYFRNSAGCVTCVIDFPNNRVHQFQRQR